MYPIGDHRVVYVTIWLLFDNIGGIPSFDGFGVCVCLSHAAITCSYLILWLGHPNAEMVGTTSFLVLALGSWLGSPGRPRARSSSDFLLECQLRWKVPLDNIPISVSGFCRTPAASLLPSAHPAGSETSGPPLGELLWSRVPMAGSPGAAWCVRIMLGTGLGFSVPCAAWPSGRAQCSPSPYSLGEEGPSTRWCESSNTPRCAR